MQVSRIPVSVFIVAQDEEAHIGRLLKSIKRFDDIVVVDSGSKDQTMEIALDAGARTYYHPWQGYAKQKQFAMELCRHKWVLNLDADEEVTPELEAALLLAISKKNASAYRLLRKDIFIGQSPPRVIKRANNLRLYRKNQATFDVSKLVHESAQVEGKEISIRQHFNHYGYEDIQGLVAKTNTYSSLRAKEKQQKGKSAYLAKLLIVFPVTFIKKYLLQRYILWGKRGFIRAMIDANYAFLKEAKLTESQLRCSEIDKNNSEPTPKN